MAPDQLLRPNSTDNEFVEEFVSLPHSSECMREVELLWTKVLERYKIERAVRMALEIQRRDKSMLQRLAPPFSQHPSQETRDEMYERVLEETQKERVALRSGRPIADETTFERLAHARERVLQMADPIAREYELSVLAEEGRRFVMDRGAKRARQMILEAEERKTQMGFRDGAEQGTESAETLDETRSIGAAQRNRWKNNRQLSLYLLRKLMNRVFPLHLGK